jgi:competence protein ComEC
MRLPLLIIFPLLFLGAGSWLGYRQFAMPSFPGPTLHISVIDVRDGDAALIQTPDGGSALFDAGGRDAAPDVASFLTRHGVRRLNLLVLSGDAQDDVGAASDALDAFPVDHVIDYAPRLGRRPSEQTLLRKLAERRVPYKTAERGQVFALGGLTKIKILLPQPGPLTARARSANNRAVAARVSFGGVNVLLVGDIDPYGEARLLANNRDLRCDILKLGRHGSSEITSNEFLRLSQPQYAVASVGADPPRGCPSRETLYRLRASGVDFKRTDENGSVIYATDGRNIQVWSER